MKKTVAATALVSGILLFLVPRYILPACEYLGHPRMHCSDTAQAEYVVGALLIVLGGVAAFVKPSAAAGFIFPSLAIIFYAVAFMLPDRLGYCLSPRMPCNYGMVPGVRFIAIASTLIMIAAIIAALRASRKKGHA